MLNYLISGLKTASPFPDFNQLSYLTTMTVSVNLSLCYKYNITFSYEYPRHNTEP